ncbi:MAG: cytochrome c4 [Gammaproteobacteria bacterium]|nr:cytochrome c4 [Gammaproteobacteria bacterium]
MKRFLFGALVLTLLTSCSQEPEPAGLVFNLDAGRAIAEAECADCHGMDGRGTTPEIPNLAAQPAEYLVEAMHAYRDGQRLHAALQDMTQGMSEADIANIAGYYASQPPLDPLLKQQNEDSSYAAGAAIGSLCEECHGEKGISTTAGIPSLAGQQPAYLIVATMEYQKGTRGHADKTEMLSGIEQVDIEKMAMYFAAQSAPARETPPFGDPLAGKVDSAVCGKCHGANGNSHDPLVPSLAGQEPVYLVNAIRAYRNHDRSSDEEMPARTDAQIENLAAYYSTQQSEASIEGAPTGKELAAKCDRCHHPSSGQRKLNVPALRGQSHDYLVTAMKEYRRNDRENSMMHKMSSRYSDEMIEALASYYAFQYE